MGQTVQYVPADQRALILPGVPADHTYTFGVRAFRRVHQDINAAGVLKSGTALSTPYTPTVAPVFMGDILGTIQGRDSLSVVLNLENIASDNVLSTTEKPGLILEYNRATSQRASLDAKAAALGAYQTERNAASAALTALDTYLSSLDPAWNDTALHSPINASTFQARWASLYAALADLDAAITARQGDPGPQGPTGPQGPGGAAGVNTATVYLFKRATSTPSKPSTTTTYTFATTSATGFNNGWSLTVPAGTDPLYVITATAAASTATDTIASNEWSSPVILAQNGGVGATGAAGAAGLNTATIYLYRRNATQPSSTIISSSKVYRFSTGELENMASNAWSQTIPENNGSPLWVTTATAASNTDTDVIETTEWSVPQMLAQDGSPGPAGPTGPQGPTGPAGLNNATVFIYKRSASTPTKPTSVSTYTFETGVLTGQNNGWTSAVPTGSNPLYVCVATASATGATDTIASNEWSSPVVLAQDGSPGAAGSTGAPGLNTATIYLYKRSTSSPPLPGPVASYTFATGVLTGHNGTSQGWSQTVPTANGQPVWVTTATAASTDASDLIPESEWAAPQILAQDGSTGPQGPTGPSGPTGNTVVYIFRRSATAPATPTGNGTPTGWSTVMPALNSTRLWFSFGLQTAAGTLIGNWSTPSSLGEIGWDDITIDESGGRGRLTIRDFGGTTRNQAFLPDSLQNDRQKWVQVTGVGKPADYATDDLGLFEAQGSGLVEIAGNKVTRISSSGWNSIVASRKQTGSVKVRAVLKQTGNLAMLGLGDGVSTSSTSYERHNFAFLAGSNTGFYKAFELGVDRGTLGVAPAVDDVLEIEYLQDKVIYWINGVNVRQVGTTSGRSLRAEMSVNNGAPFANISFTPTADDTKIHGIEAGATVGATSAERETFNHTAKLTTNNSGVRVGGPRNLPPIVGMNTQYRYTGAITYTATAGTPATATISCAAGNALIGSSPVAYNAMSVNVSGTGGNTVKYYLYVEESATTTGWGGAKTLVATTNRDDLLANDNRVWIGTVDVVYPTSGSGSGSGGGGGGGYRIDECVDCYSFMPDDRLAMDVRSGDKIRIIDESTWDSSTETAVAGTSHVPDVPCVRLTSSSGITVVISESTPCTLRGGRVVYAPFTQGCKLAVEDENGFRWEEIVNVEEVGRRTVARISVTGRTYAAGERPGRFIYTHNNTFKT